MDSGFDNYLYIERMLKFYKEGGKLGGPNLYSLETKNREVVTVPITEWLYD